VIVMPAVTLGLPYLALREEARLRDAPARVAVVGTSGLEDFLNTATAQRWIEVVPVRDPRAALKRGTVHAVLEASREGSAGPVRLRVLYDEGSIASLLARQKIDQAVAGYSLAQVEAQLSRRGISAERLLPIQVEHAGIGPADSAGRAQLAVVLPFFMTVWMLLGGQYAALDLGAGERERGTLPGLLLTPPDRLALVLGKFATVFTLATTSVGLVVGTVIFSLRLAPLAAAPASLSGGAVVSLMGVGLVFAAFLGCWWRGG
jgi:sodium transport system permease protein